MATIRKLKNKREVRKYGQYHSKTFDTKIQAQAWAVETEQNLDPEGLVKGKTLGDDFIRYRVVAFTQSDTCRDGRLDAQHEPANKFNEIERQRILSIANAPEYAHLPPSQIVPKLADQGVYIASESTCYRVLKDARQLSHRQSSKPRTGTHKPQPLTARAPNQVYSWDITYLSAGKGNTPSGHVTLRQWQPDERGYAADTGSHGIVQSAIGE